MPALIIQTGKQQGKQLKLPKKEVFVGRDDDCEIRISSSDVSRRHCSIRGSGINVIIRDLDSQNGTYVNDVRIDEEMMLAPGDLIRVGPMQFVVAGKSPKNKIDDQDSGNLSDDDIASWLSTEDSVGDVNSGDTTIIPGKPKAEPKSKPAPKPRKQEYKSLADEAADIIREHWEKVNAEKETEENS